MATSILRPIVAGAMLLFAAARVEAGVRIKDIAEWAGARSNYLVGFGLVTGLDNTGSRSIATQQLAADMLSRFKFVARVVPEARGDTVIRSGSISAVMVTATLGPFARHGSTIDVTVSVLDEATSLQGGTLILTPLKGADGVDYAVAQGPVTVGGFSFNAQASGSTPAGGGTPSASARKNHPTVGRIPGGAIVEHEVLGNIVCDGQLRLLLHEADPVTARNMVRVINDRFAGSAVIVDSGTVQVVPPNKRDVDAVAFAGEIGLLEVSPDAPARVVLNERTGTVVAGEQVKISMVAIANGNLAIVTNEDLIVSQPAPFTNGSTVVAPQPRLDVAEQGGAVRVLPRTVTVAELARALNALGVSPRDLIAIFQALKRVGALHAELIVM